MGANLGVVVFGGLGLALVVWLLHKLGRALAAIAEVLAAAAVVFIALWWLVKTVVWLGKQVLAHPRTTAGVLVILAWWRWLGWPSLLVSAGVLVVALLGWRLVDLPGFDRRAGRWLRGWWLRWFHYGRRLPAWLHACGLTVRDDAVPVSVTVNLVGRQKVRQQKHTPAVRYPKVLGVCSGPSWDRVKVRLVAGQTPEDFDPAARPLASAATVGRCQVRELSPNVVSIDFQRRNLLASAVTCADLAGLVDVPGDQIDLRRVVAGRTEYGQPWRVSLVGGHMFVAGATGAGKGSVLWSPLVSIAPAIRAGLVRVSGIDPKGMELAYGRRLFHRYAVTGKDAVPLLDDLIAVMDDRKTRFAGKVRQVPVSTADPVELLEFDELGALTKYTDRKTREQITERVAILTTQGRALGITVRGYVQEPTKDTVPVRELFPRRVCLRVTAKSHVSMVLGDGAFERGAWANRIQESEAGVGYVFGDGLREPLRVRAGWVPDTTVKALETFATTGTVITLPKRSDQDSDGTAGGAAA